MSSIDFSAPGYRNPTEFLNHELNRIPDLKRYVHGLLIRYRSNPLWNTLEQLAITVEPTDRSLGKVQKAPKGNAFYVGCLIGLHMIEYCTPEAVRQQLPEVEFGLPDINADSKDAQADEVAAADAIIDRAEQGLRQFPELADVLTRLEEGYTNDVTLQPFVRRGVGIMLDAMQQAHELVAMQGDPGVAAASRDWDAAFQRELLGE